MFFWKRVVDRSEVRKNKLICWVFFKWTKNVWWERDVSLRINYSGITVMLDSTDPFSFQVFMKYILIYNDMHGSKCVPRNWLFKGSPGMLDSKCPSFIQVCVKYFRNGRMNKRISLNVCLRTDHSRIQRCKTPKILLFRVC